MMTDDGPDPVLAALDAAGVGIGDVSHIVISHRHGDHTGSLADLVAMTDGARVLAGVPDLDRIRSSAPDAEEASDGDDVFGLRIVATPGHTEGHISAFDTETGLLLSGDALVFDSSIGGTTGEGIEASPPDFTDDTDAALASVGRLADLEPATILFGHGGALTEDAATMLRTYADSLA